MNRTRRKWKQSEVSCPSWVELIDEYVGRYLVQTCITYAFMTSGLKHHGPWKKKMHGKGLVSIVGHPPQESECRHVTAPRIASVERDSCAVGRCAVKGNERLGSGETPPVSQG